MLKWLRPGEAFPPADKALKDPNGLVCAGGDLSPARLLDAYRHGIFPWYSGDEPILWWSPDPRLVLYCAELKVSRSLAKSVRNKGYELRIDTAFREVLAGPAPQPLAAILLEHDAATDELSAVGTLGGEMFNEFFARYEFRLALDSGGAPRRAVQGSAVVTELENYCKQQVKC